MTISLIDQIDAILPQTQCTRCKFPSCQDYAQALAEGVAEINQCPPGGEAGIAALAQLLKRDILPLNPDCGAIKPRQIALIDEARCIGCTLCIKACPVDAIIGANKMMHTVIADACSGCDLCLPACPVDCIVMLDDNLAWDNLRSKAARQRFDGRKMRREDERLAREARLAKQAELLKRVNPATAISDKVNAVIKPSAEVAESKSEFIARIMAKAQKKLDS